MNAMHNYVYSIQLDAERTAAVLDRLDRDDKQMAPGRQPASVARHSYRKRAVTVEFARATGEWAVHIIPPRFVSARACSVLTGHFVCPGTNCRVELQARDGSTHAVDATVTWCRYVTGTVRIHEAGIEFSRPVDLAAFVELAAAPAGGNREPDPPLDSGALRPAMADCASESGGSPHGE